MLENRLLECLSSITPLELQAVKLVQDIQQNGFEQVSSESISSATHQLVQYVDECRELEYDLRNLAAIVLKNLECSTWPL